MGTILLYQHAAFSKGTSIGAANNLKFNNVTVVHRITLLFLENLSLTYIFFYKIFKQVF